MYRVTYRDTDTDKQVTIKVHSMKSVQVLTDTLNRNPWRYKNITFQRVMPTRFRDIIIVVQ